MEEKDKENSFAINGCNITRKKHDNGSQEICIDCEGEETLEIKYKGRDEDFFKAAKTEVRLMGNLLRRPSKMKSFADNIKEYTDKLKEAQELTKNLSDNVKKDAVIYSFMKEKEKED